MLKDYLGSENARNKQHAATYVRLMKLAFGDVNILIGHHLTFEKGDDLETENEIPSADCLMFDHYVMEKVFGEQYRAVMVDLVHAPCEERDVLLKAYLDQRETLITDLSQIA